MSIVNPSDLSRSLAFSKDDDKIGFIPSQVVTLKDQSKIVLRPMKLSDYSAVRALLPGVSQCNLTHSDKDVLQILGIPTYHPFCALSEQSGELLGFAELHRMPHIGRSFDGRLERVVVTKDSRGKGVASALCSYIIDLAEKVLWCNRVDLTVENPQAKHIYMEKLNFTTVPTNVMRLRLPRPEQEN